MARSTGSRKNYYTAQYLSRHRGCDDAEKQPGSPASYGPLNERGSRTRLASFGLWPAVSRIPKWRAKPAQGWEIAANPRTGPDEAGPAVSLFRPRCACEAPSSRMNGSCASLAAAGQKPPTCSHPSRVVWDCSLSLSRDCQCECHGHAGRQRQTTSAVTGGGWCAFGFRRGASRRGSSCTEGGRGVGGRLSLDPGHPGNTRGTGSAASGGGSGAKRKIWSVDWSVWGVQVRMGRTTSYAIQTPC